MKIIQLAHRTVDELLEEIFAITSKQKIDTDDRRVLYALACAMKNRYENDVPKWIPVSERMPETGGESFFDGMVLITLRDKETGDLYVLNDKYCGDGDWLMCVPDEPTEVIAWMPLPEAYKPNKK